jgi:predicted dithiol-disulfide oxidoreductase (DUF899 family)
MSSPSEASTKHGDFPAKHPPVVSHEEWAKAHEAMVAKEKVQTKARDALVAERRRMPWMAVEAGYEFEGPSGAVGLLDLFEGRRQLIVYRAFFEPGVHGWPDHGCRGCSFQADQVAHLAHLNARDVTLVYASRAPQRDIARLQARMGWERIPWYTITDSFDVDFGVDQWHGHNAFIQDGERIFRTYFINGRGDEAMGTTWSYLDMTALGRQELWEDSPEGYPQSEPYKGGTGTITIRRTANSIPSGRRSRPPVSPPSSAVSTTVHDFSARRRELTRLHGEQEHYPASRDPSLSWCNSPGRGRPLGDPLVSS